MYYCVSYQRYIFGSDEMACKGVRYVHCCCRSYKPLTIEPSLWEGSLNIFTLATHCTCVYCNVYLVTLVPTYPPAYVCGYNESYVVNACLLSCQLYS